MKIGYTIVIIFGFILYPAIIVSGQDFEAFAPIKTDDSLINSLDFSIGLEILRYEEAEPSSKTLSKAETMNVVGNFCIYQEYQQFQGGLKGSIPLKVEKDTETWEHNNIADYQDNSFSSSWSRIDGFIGYSFKDDYFTMPGIWYAGLRRSENILNRDNVVASGTPISTGSKTTVQSYSLFMGYGAKTTLVESRRPLWNPELVPVLTADYQIEYHKPIFNRVRMSNRPEVFFKDTSGYTIDLKGRISYIISSGLSAVFNIYGGRMFWQGSSWKDFGTGPVKWRENKTDYLGANFGLSLVF
jgi:hypothetical protein